ncbi:hypothetical protein BDF21DRAFT_441384 [Thamnidium elegans]|nr:hypothetical protein BDF21DRAFT_441384 [Thamnidium elegans]
MITTTRERVICMFYHQGYNDTKAIELLNAIEKLDLEICYKDNLCKPFLLYTNSIKAGPYNNHIYQKTTKTPERNNQIENLPEKTAYGFGKWCNSRKLFLTESQIKRKYDDLQQKVSVRSLYVLKDEYIGKTFSNHSWFH